jgi:hypothetical protein
LATEREKRKMSEKFVRSVDGDLIKRMKSEPLWKNLCEDCKKGEVFLAIRNKAISFYHKGGRLFTYNMEEGFKTHVKYASIIEAEPDEDSDLNYLTEAKLKKYKPINDFASHYGQIKKNCEILAGKEAFGVSNIYKNYSYLSKNDIVVLDLEVTLTSGKERVDILLFNKATRSLQFVEAKDYSNQDLFSTTEPKVIKQMQRYETQLNKKGFVDKVVKEYNGYIEVLNELFGTKLPPAKEVLKTVILLIFGFDANQRDGRLDKWVRANQCFKGKRVYTKQKSIDPKDIWSQKPL